MTTPPNPWLWLGPYALLMLFMVYAMMEFTVSLLAGRPPTKRKPLTAGALRAKLAALAVESEPYTLREGDDCDIELIRVAGERIAEPRLRARRNRTVRLRLLLDEERHEVRIGETAYSSGYIIGLAGWWPRLGAFAGYSAGPPGASKLTNRIRATVLDSGWSYRPVVLPFHATYNGLWLARRLTPGPLRRVRPIYLWGLLYLSSYWLGMGWLVALGGPEIRTAGSLMVLALVSAAWWGLWAFLAWALCGFPRFWHRSPARG